MFKRISLLIIAIGMLAACAAPIAPVAPVVPAAASTSAPTATLPRTVSPSLNRL